MISSARPFLVWSSDMRRRSADDDSLAELILQEIFVQKDADEIEALLPVLPPPLDRLTLAAEALQSQGIRARVANGVYLDEARRRTEVQHWLEYHVDGRDKRYFIGSDPKEFFTIWYGTEEMIRADGVFDFEPQVSIQPIDSSASDVVRKAARADRTPVELFSFDRLPVTTQLVYQVLITIPAGIVLLVFMRQFIGIETLGTFMPILIGIAFRETALLNGLILFTMLVALGLAMRFYLEKLRLLLVPRLAVVLIFIVICMAVIAQTFNRRQHAHGAFDLAVPDGHPDHDDRTHVDHVGRIFRRRCHQGRRRLDACGLALLSGDDEQAHRIPAVQFP
jgi:hypothetical protein